MKLENLFTHFKNLTEEEQVKYVENYRLKRSNDMLSVIQYAKKKAVNYSLTKSGRKKSNLAKKDISEEAQKMLGSLGLTISDVNKLRK